jgi:hypothetical protein
MERLIPRKNLIKYFDLHHLNQQQLMKIILQGLLAILFIIPFALYIYFVVKYSVNIPYWDDYTGMDNLMSFLEIEEIIPKVKYLFRQHNEHRVVFDRIVFLANFYIFGNLNFRQLSFFGNLGWILTIFVLMMIFRREYNLPNYYLLPVPYILFNFIQSENMFFPMASIQFYWSLLFAVLFIQSLVHERIFLSIFVLTIALFTSGGGVLLIPLGIIFFLIRNNIKGFVLFGIASLLLTTLYFYHYESVPYHPSISSSFINFEQTITYFFVFLGNLTASTDTALIFGALSSLAAIFLVIRQTEHFFAPLLIGYISLIAITTAITRSGFGLPQALSSRYTSYSLIFLVCLNFLVLSSVENKLLKRRFLLFTLVLGMTYFGGVLLKTNLCESFERQKAEKIFGITSYFNGNNSNLAHQYKDVVADILSSSIDKGVYNFQDIPKYPVEEINPIIDSSANILSHVDYYDGYQIEGWAILPGEIASHSKISLLLSDGKTIFRVAPFNMSRPDVSQAFGRKFQYDDSGFKAYLSTYSIPGGNYKLGLLIENGDKFAVNWTEHTFTPINATNH